jgi:hypothetical protein
MVGQHHITTIQLGALIYFAFPISMAMQAADICDVYGLIHPSRDGLWASLAFG